MTSFVRDRFTWLAYGMLAYFAYLQASLGPAIPFLRQELNLSYTVAGLHATILALGMILAGLSADRVAQRWGRRAVFWIGGAGMALGALLLTLGRSPLFTVASAGVMGTLGGLLLIMVQSTLADHHGSLRATALTEANLVAAVGALAVPSLIGGFQTVTLGWRMALILAVLAWMITFWRFRHVAVPERLGEASASDAPQERSRNSPLPQQLPGTFWILWSVIFSSVAIEWSMGFWGAEFMESSTGLNRAAASSAMSLFFGAIVVGRFFGSRLTQTYESTTLLLGALSLVAIGFPFFWLSPSIPLTLLGLFLAGLGIANLFPLTLSAATSVAAAQSDTASARISLGAGAAIFLAPQILGALADRFGIQWAYGIVIVLLVTALITTLIARQWIVQREPVQTG